MAIFYLDPINGNDANDGSNWANAWKTITSGATAARTAPGDTIRIAKSPDPVSIGSCTFTNGNGSVTIPSGLILDICTCESNWTASANITCATNTTYRSQGSYCVSITPATAFTTGLAAYFATGTLDLSSYQKVGFFVRLASGTPSSGWRLDLCSDAAGTTPVHSITIPYIGSTGQFITFDNGSALSSSIQSVALTALSDPGTAALYIDNIIAFNTLGLGSVISASSSGPWFPIMCISGTTVTLGYMDGGTRLTCFYDGTTATTTGYSRDTLFLLSTNMTVQESGTFGNLITYSGGWNTSSNLQDGETWSRGGTGAGAIVVNSKDYIQIDGICAAYSRYVIDNPRYGCILNNAKYSGCIEGFFYAAVNTCMKLTGTFEGVGATSGGGLYTGTDIYLQYIEGDANITIHNVYSSSSYCCVLYGNWYLTGTLKIDCSLYGTYAFRLGTGNKFVRRVEITGSSSTGGIYLYDNGITRFDELVTSGAGATITSYSTGVSHTRLDIGYFSGDAGVSGTIYGQVNIERYLTDGRYYSARQAGIICDHITGGQSAGWAYGGSGLSLYLNPSNTYNHLIHEMFVPVQSGTSYSFHFRKIKTSSSATCTLKTYISGCGITTVDESVTLTDSWAEYQSTSFTPTRDGFVRVALDAIDGLTTGDIGVDDIHLALAA